MEPVPTARGVDSKDSGERFSAYRWKMALLGLFLFANVVFFTLIVTLPSKIVAFVFFGYIVLSAAPKFIFGSLLHRIRIFARGEPKLGRPLGDEDDDADGMEAGNPRSTHRAWSVTGDGTKVLVSACVTVHHEDSEGLAAGVASFESSDLPFGPGQLQIVYIVDGRRDRSGKLDHSQETSARFLLARLTGTQRKSAKRAEAMEVDEDGVIVPNTKRISGPHIQEDGTAAYYGLLKCRSGKVPYVVLYKRTNGGKRHSHKMFFDMTDRGLLQKPAHAVMFVDSDVMFSWPGRRNSLAQLYSGLMERKKFGGAAGEIEVWKWMKNVVTITQYFEYKSNQFLAKTFESFFGLVTCLPGAFCMVRPQALEMVLNKYLAVAESVFDKNKLDLGEDRTLTTLILQAGWSTTYVPSAVAKTEVPDTLIKLIRQRRRWITIVNMATLLTKVHRVVALPLFISLAIELFSSFVLPTTVLMLFYEMGLSLGVSGPLVIAILVLWVISLIVLSMSASVEGSLWLYENSAIIGAFVVLLMIITTIQDIGALQEKFYMEIVVVTGWVFCIVGASFIHGQWSSVLGAVAPLCWLLFSPTMYVVIPIYSVCQFDDISWGTRGS